MITFKTKILSMSTIIEPTPNYVVGVLFTVIGETDVDSLITLNLDSYVNFDVNPTQTNFAPYSELTEEEVLSWIDSTLIDSMKTCIENQIECILNPPIVPEITPLPW